MKTDSYKVSVGLLGLLPSEKNREEDGTRTAEQESSPVVGFSKNAPKPDHETRPQQASKENGRHKSVTSRADESDVRGDGGLPPTDHPAWSILATCRKHGVALRIDTDGDLVVGKAGAKADGPTQPWPELLVALESHLETVARLVEADWHLRAKFPGEKDP